MPTTPRVSTEMTGTSVSVPTGGLVPTATLVRDLSLRIDIHSYNNDTFRNQSDRRCMTRVGSRSRIKYMCNFTYYRLTLLHELFESIVMHKDCRLCTKSRVLPERRSQICGAVARRLDCRTVNGEDPGSSLTWWLGG